MSIINDDDKFLVRRGGVDYQISAEDLMSIIQDTDNMLIERGGQNYTVSCEDVKDQLGGGGSSPNPDDSAGPILTVDFNGSTTTLSLANSQNLGGFSAGDAVVMTDINGSVGSYTPVTSDITSVSDKVAINAPDSGCLLTGGGYNNEYGYYNQPNNQVGPMVANQLIANYTISDAPPTDTVWVSSGLRGGHSCSATLTINGEPTVYNSNSTTPPEGSVATGGGGYSSFRFDLGSVRTITNLVFTLNNPNPGDDSSYHMVFVGFYWDDQKIVDGGGESGKLLELTTVKDLYLFQPDDIVQAPDVKVITTDLISTPPTMLVDGGNWGNDPETGYIKEQVYSANSTRISNPTYTFNGSDEWCTSTNTGSDSYFEFDPPLRNVNQLYIYGVRDNNDFFQGFWSAGSEIFVVTTDNTRYSNNPATNMSALPINPEGKDVKRVGTRGTTNMFAFITYSGGDGSGELKDKLYDINVTGPTKTGTGVFESSSSGEMVVNTSNSAWVAGRNFYVKVDNTRTAYTPTEIGPFNVQNYYPLYTTQAGANAAGNGSSTALEFFGATYYMPEGVSQFFGNYSA